MVGCSSWIGTEIPDCANVELRNILRLTHHAHKGQHLVCWVPKRLPKDLVRIGQIELTDEELNADCHSYGYWDSITCQPLTQWRWDNDRQAAYADDEIAERERDKMAEEATTLRAAYLGKLTLKKLSEETPLPNWSGHVDTQIVRQGRKIIRETVRHLVNIGRHAPKRDKITVMENCMALLADLGVQYIDTESRYEVFNDIEALAHACGIPEEVDQIYSKRNW